MTVAMTLTDYLESFDPLIIERQEQAHAEFRARLESGEIDLRDDLDKILFQRMMAEIRLRNEHARRVIEYFEARHNP